MQDFTKLVNKGRVVNLLPSHYMETRTCQEICELLAPQLPPDIKIVIRSWEAENTCQDKHISIITSAEAHTYVPPEVNKSNCVASFMHYYPKTFAYDPNQSAFIGLPKLYPLPLGTISAFKAPKYVPIKERKYDCCFIGQLDPYRRSDFFNAVANLAENPRNYIHFYKGWNKGFSSEIYAEILSQSKVALVPCGSASLDTFRFYEAAECGCAIVACQQNPYEFITSSFYVNVKDNDWSLASRLIDLGDDVLQDLSNKTLNAWENNLSPQASANYILEKLKPHINPQ